MKVTILGQEKRMNRVARHLEALNIEATVVSGLVECLLDADAADLVLIDLGHDNAPAICSYLRAETATPIIGLIDPDYAGWTSLTGIEMSGFVPVAMNEHELSARLKAMTRWAVTV